MMKSENTEANKYILSSKINLAARRLLNVAKNSQQLEEGLKKMTLSSVEDAYINPQVCIHYSNSGILILEQNKVNLQLYARLKFLLSKSEQKHGQQKTYTESYSVTAEFLSEGKAVFSSQIECIKLSATEHKKPYRVSEIKTLPAEKEGIGGASYENIKYQCWEYIDNNVLKMVFKGNLSKNLSYDKCISCSQIIAMLICESSRNPSSYFTAPMVLDLIEYWINNHQRLILDMERLFSIEYNTDAISTGRYMPEETLDKKFGGQEAVLRYFTDKRNEHKDVCLNNNPIAYAFFKVFYLRAELTELRNIEEKSSIISSFINALFPMAGGGAVSVSRHITNILNENIDNETIGSKKMEKHYYDLGVPTTGSKLASFINKEKILATLWSQCYPNKSLNQLTQDWFGIDLEEPFVLTAGDIFPVEDIPFL